MHNSSLSSSAPICVHKIDARSCPEAILTTSFQHSASPLLLSFVCFQARITNVEDVRDDNFTVNDRPIDHYKSNNVQNRPPKQRPRPAPNLLPEFPIPFHQEYYGLIKAFLRHTQRLGRQATDKRSSGKYHLQTDHAIPVANCITLPKNWLPTVWSSKTGHRSAHYLFWKDSMPFGRQYYWLSRCMKT